MQFGCEKMFEKSLAILHIQDSYYDMIIGSHMTYHLVLLSIIFGDL